MMNTAKFFSSGQESSTIFSSTLHTKQLSSINKKVIKVDALLKNSLSLRKKLQEKTVIKKSQSSFQEREKNLEKTKPPETEKGIKSVPTPKGGGIFGWLGNFINTVIFGFIAIRLLDHLPTLLKLVPIINNVMDGIIDWGGKLLEGLVTFIDWGYSAYDNTVKIFGKFGGEGAAKKFQDFMGKFQNVIQYSLIAGMLFSDLALSGGGGGGGDVVTDVVGDVVEEQIKNRVIQEGGKQVAQQAGRTLAVGTGTAAAIVVGVGLLASALGEGAFQLKKFSKKIEKDAFKKRDELKKNWQKTPAWNVLGKAWNLAQYSFFETLVVPGMRLTNWLLNGLGITLDIIGAPFRYAVELIRWALMALNNDTKGMAEQRKNLGKFDARIRDGIREHFAGFLGPIFRVIGKKDWADKIEKQGSWGSLYGNKAVKDMYGYASGGSTRGGQYLSDSARREIRPQKKLRRVVTKPAKLYQGRTAGGVENIQKIFPEAKNITTQKGTGPQSKDETMNPYGFVSHSYYRMASVPFVGPILAMPLKVMMGDTIDSAYYTSVGQGFSGMMAKAYDEGAFSEDFPVQEFDFEKIVSKSIQQLATREMTSIRSHLMQQLMLEKIKSGGGEGTEGDECICPDSSGAGANIQGGTTDFWTLVAVASREDGDPQSWADVAQSIYNRAASGAYGGGTKSIKDLITATWQFEPTWRYPNGGSAGKPNRQWFTITDASSAAAASGQSIDAMKSVASALLNPSLQANARNFVQGRTDFTGYSKSARTGQVQRKSGDNYFGWDWNYKGNTVAGVPNFSASASSSGTSSTLIASSSPAGSVPDCSCDGDGVPDPNGIDSPTNPAAYGEGKGKQIYLHWTAGSHSSVPRGSYHTVITGDGKTHNVIPYTQTGEHTYRRNTASVGLSLAAMGGSPDPWSIPPTSAQLSGMAMEVAKIATAWGWSASDINIRNVLTHAEAGSNKDGRNMHENYGPKAWGGTGERWDLFQLKKGDTPGSGGDAIRNMIKAKMGSAGKFGGGPVNEGLTKVHPGEFIIDKDSVDVFGMEFMSIINQVENKSQLRRAKDSLIQILMEKVPHYSDMSPDEYVTVPSSGGGYGQNFVVLSGSVSGGGSSDSCPWKDQMAFGN